MKSRQMSIKTVVVWGSYSHRHKDGRCEELSIAAPIHSEMFHWPRQPRRCLTDSAILKMDNWWVIYKWHSHGWLECQGSLSEVVAGGTGGLWSLCRVAVGDRTEVLVASLRCLDRHIMRGGFLGEFYCAGKNRFVHSQDRNLLSTD